jgi:hypothetical protein
MLGAEERGVEMPRRALAAVCLALASGVASAVVVRSPEPRLAPVAAPPADACPSGCAEAREVCPVLPAEPRVAITGQERPPGVPIPAALAPADAAGHAGGDADGSLAPRKRAWEESVGGAQAAKQHLRARLSGWPERRFAERGAPPAEDRAFLAQVARDTWRGIAALTDRENGLPIDHLRLGAGSLAAADAQIGDYVSPSSIGLYLVAVAAAFELELASRAEALARLERVLETVRRLETHAGVPFNFYDTTSLERTSGFVSFIDSAWLSAGLMVVRSTFPELAETASAMIESRDYAFFYDPEYHQMSHGYYVDDGVRSPYHYATLYTEARLGSLIAIGKGDVPEDHWFRMLRTFPPTCTWQSLPPQGRRQKQVRGHRVIGGFYEWKGLRYVPSWGGSMFEALMPTLLVDEKSIAPRSLGRNAEVHVEVQRRYALEELGWPVWGMSPSFSPAPPGYREYGVPVLGARGYEDAAVTPHAVALALSVAPAEATRNLRRLVERYEIYGDYGFFDSVDPRTGAVAPAYLVLDQAMLFVALANHLEAGVVQRRFASDPIAARALSILADEDFLD